MKTTVRTRIATAALAACAVAVLAAPAWGQSGGGLELRRDRPKAVPVVAEHGVEGRDRSGGLELRRDGSRAVSFVPQVGPEPAASTTNGFHWGDAAIGAGLGAAAVLMAGAAVRASGGSRRRRGVSARATEAAAR